MSINTITSNPTCISLLQSSLNNPQLPISFVPGVDCSIISNNSVISPQNVVDISLTVRFVGTWNTGDIKTVGNITTNAPQTDVFTVCKILTDGVETNIGSCDISPVTGLCTVQTLIGSNASATTDIFLHAVYLV